MKAPAASSAVVRKRMQRTPQRDTPEELAIRSILHRSGLRFRVHASAVPGLRSRPDIVFGRTRVAVFIDGCFWHGCPKHGTWPKANAEWWKNKIEANRARDRRTTTVLRRSGWMVLRLWTHESASHAAKRIIAALRRRSN